MESIISWVLSRRFPRRILSTMTFFADGSVVRAPSFSLWRGTHLNAFGEVAGLLDARRRRQWHAFGWLDPDADYRTGQCPQSVVHGLIDAARKPVQQTRGFHHCALCGTSDASSMGTAYQTPDGGNLILGSACLEMQDRERQMWIAPNLVLHYIDAHQYLPPDPILQAFGDTV